jgi:SAM-dependent methyltransferase
MLLGWRTSAASTSLVMKGVIMRKAWWQIFALLRQHSRQKRYLKIQELMKPEHLSGFILDLGGGPASFFAALFPEQSRVILVDISYDEVLIAKQRYPLLSVIVADGKHLPLADRSIDLTVCNSVIEHVDDPKALAIEIRRVSRNYFLQTPHGGFPLETHSFIPIPFYGFLPWELLRRFACKLFGARFEYLQSVRYLSEVELRCLFPEATIYLL